MLTRRSLLIGLVAAPAIVRVSSLMPLSVWIDSPMTATEILMRRHDESEWLQEQRNKFINDFVANYFKKLTTYSEQNLSEKYELLGHPKELK